MLREYSGWQMSGPVMIKFTFLHRLNSSLQFWGRASFTRSWKKINIKNKVKLKTIWKVSAMMRHETTFETRNNRKYFRLRNISISSLWLCCTVQRSSYFLMSLHRLYSQSGLNFGKTWARRGEDMTHKMLGKYLPKYCITQHLHLLKFLFWLWIF